MSDTDVIQVCPLFPTLFGSYINELETYLNENSVCLFNMVVSILLYVHNVDLLSNLGSALQQPFNKLSSSLVVNLS